MKTDQSVFLNHISDAIKKIEKYIQEIDEEAFKKNDLVQDGVIRQMEIIGEAVKRLSGDLTGQSPQVPWQDIAGMRDKLIHDYFGVDIDTGLYTRFAKKIIISIYIISATGAMFFEQFRRL